MTPKITPEQPEKFDLRSHDIPADKQTALRVAFPEVFTEGGRVDFEKLKLALGESVDVGKERYGMNWPGKADCFKTIQQPSMATLVPGKAESVAWDTTENLIIEGDNLEVLKLLQKSYLGRVKMIYIDPPYNTGNDFIYPDNYAESLETYLRYTGQVDSEGRKYSTNTEADGRFHSKWLNMMYPRLYLARNLLREDGVIFISIDEHEVDNLRKLCNEVFGEENFVGQVAVVNNLKGRNDKKNLAACHEYLLVFSKTSFLAGGLPLTDEQRAQYSETDEYGEKYTLRDLRKRGSGDRREDRPNMFFPIYLNQESKTFSLTKTTETDVEILPFRGDGSDGRWRWGKERVAANLALLESRFTDRSQRWGLSYRVYLNPGKALAIVGGEPEAEDDEDDERTSKAKSVWIGPEFSTDIARRTFKAILPDADYDYPKPVELLVRCLYLGTSANDIILDFFAGSGTTGHAILDVNKVDGGNRTFVLVQLPEPTEQKGFPTIAEITKERVRRVIKKLNDEDAGKLALENGMKPDRGFKVFKLQSSNFKTWNADVPKEPAALEQQLEMHVRHIVEGRTQEDLLFEILLKSGFPPTTPIETLTLAEQTVFSIAEGAMLICLEKTLTPEVIKEMAARKPERVVCLDEGFAGNDQLKTNAVQTMKTKGVTSFRTV